MKILNISKIILEAATKVHAELGNEFEKNIYQGALEKEMIFSGLMLERDCKMNIFYNGDILGSRTVDFLIEKCIILDILALAHFESYHVIQAKSSLEVYNIEAGLLINFGTQSLQYRKVVNELYKKS